MPSMPANASDNVMASLLAKKIKASVTGVGDSKSKAESDAARSAREVAGGSYTTLRKNTSGSGKNWTCTMTIEYTEKK